MKDTHRKPYEQLLPKTGSHSATLSKITVTSLFAFFCFLKFQNKTKNTVDSYTDGLITERPNEGWHV